MTGPVPLAITMGDPAGIGIEITAKAWLARGELNMPTFFLIGNKRLIDTSLADIFDTLPTKKITSAAETNQVFSSHLPVYDPEETGAAPAQTLAAIRTGVRLCQTGEASGLVTNPIQKKRLYDSGFSHPGHTEYLADLTAVPGQAVMMFACRDLKVVPATIHVPLSQVPKTLTAAHLEKVIRTTAGDLTEKFGISSPTVVIAGLNPHAGEEGSIGQEEMTMISPVIRKLHAEGLRVSGPFPADSLFHPAAREKYDAAICMYHDQALIPIKTIDFENGVNVTLGLPIIRTSPDHGTADDIAGQGIASPASLIAAIRMADEMRTHTDRQTHD